MTETTLAVEQDLIVEEVKQFIFRNHKEIKVSETQMAMCLKLAQEYNLSPLKREIHFLPFWNQTTKQMDLQPVIAYTEYIKKAQTTGKLNGWKYEIGISEEAKKDMRCKVTIYRKDWDHPLEHTVWYSEVAQKTKDGKPNNNWANKPRFMIMKVAIAQGMRLAFPEDLGAMPYEDAEMRNTEKEIRDEKLIQLDDQREEMDKKIKLNELQSARVRKMGMNSFELLTTLYQRVYGIPMAEMMTLDQIGELKFFIQDTTPDHIKQRIELLDNPETADTAKDLDTLQPINDGHTVGKKKQQVSPAKGH